MAHELKTLQWRRWHAGQRYLYWMRQWGLCNVYSGIDFIVVAQSNAIGFASIW